MKISVIDGYTENPGDLSWDGLRALGDVVIYDHSTKDEAEIIRRVGDAEIVVANKSPISRRVLDACPNVKYITVQATGYDPINYVYAREKGIPVSNVPTYGTASVAQFAIALLLEICGHAAHHSDAVHAGRWAECGEWTFWDHPMIELAGKTMGIIGFRAHRAERRTYCQGAGDERHSVQPQPAASRVRRSPNTWNWMSFCAVPTSCRCTARCFRRLAELSTARRSRR